MGQNRELPTYTLLNPEFHTLEDVSLKGESTQENAKEMTGQDESNQYE